VSDSGDRIAFHHQAALLGEIGAVLARAELPNIEVRLPAMLARAAVEAWEYNAREDIKEETLEQRVERNQAGAVALIGLAVSEHGRNNGDEVVVELSPGLIGAALDAADEG
jgi:hypothetical protein